MPTAGTKTSAHTQGFVDPVSLHFDKNNPRFAGARLNNDDDIVRELYEQDDVDELIQSILSTGYLDFEPLIVLQEGSIVLEGNRRLAALRLISDDGLRRRLKVSLPPIENPQPVPNEVRVLFVNSREDARSFIGFKHINGPFKWDAIAKAKYAADWVQNGGEIEAIARTLGDNHNTVRRLVDGWFAYQQAIDEGFDPNQISNKRFAFSHLYTALTKPSVRSMLGLNAERSSKQPGAHPIPSAKREELLQLMSWLYGQDHKSETPIIRTQNPDLNLLSAVLGNPEAKAMLIATRDLDKSHERVVPAAARFEDALMRASSQSEDALRLAGAFDGDSTLIKVAEGMQRTTRSLVAVMREQVEKSSGDGQ
jgi:hypothetical protein